MLCLKKEDNLKKKWHYWTSVFVTLGLRRGLTWGRDQTFPLWLCIPAKHSMVWVRIGNTVTWNFLPCLAHAERNLLFQEVVGYVKVVFAPVRYHTSPPAFLHSTGKHWNQCTWSESRGSGLSAPPPPSPCVLPGVGSCGRKVICLCEFLFSVTLPAVWFPKQLSELLIKPHVHLKEIGLSPSNLLIIFPQRFFFDTI